MRIRILVSIIITFLVSFFANAKDVYVNGYYRNNGTYVQPHMRSSPDNNRFNNYSTQGNYNPYTGRSGTVNPYNNTYGNSYGNGSYSKKKSNYGNGY